jgi:hypothetical protein
MMIKLTSQMFYDLIELDHQLSFFYPSDDRTQYIDLSNYKINRNLRKKNVKFIVPPSSLLETNKINFENIQGEIENIYVIFLFKHKKINTLLM